MPALNPIEVPFPDRNADAVQRAKGGEENRRENRCRSFHKNMRRDAEQSAGGKQRADGEFLQRNCLPNFAMRVIDRQIRDGECTQNCTGYGRFIIYRSQDNDHVEGGDADDGDEPKAFVSQAELLSHRFRLPADQRN
jgi:hypothetical protein